MNQNSLRLAVAITGASGSFIAQQLLRAIKTNAQQVDRCDVVISATAQQVVEFEVGSIDVSGTPFKLFKPNDFTAAMASGSAFYDAMVICPCSMGTLGRIANGVSNDLITRAADVFLKERRPLILVVREAPYNLIHIRNMEQLTLAGGIVFPASPSFYHHPVSIEQLYEPMIERVLKMLGFQLKTREWGIT